VTDAAPSARPRLTFFFPAYNEQENIERTVELALSQMGPLVPSIEVLAIDDGSTDNTAALADALAAADPRVRVWPRPIRGCGCTISRTVATAARSRRASRRRAAS